MLTVSELEMALPPNSKGMATPALVNQINGLVTDPDIRDTYKKNILGMAAVLQNPNVSMEDYLHAVAFVGYKHMGHDDNVAWALTFPQKHAQMVAAGVKTATIKGHVRAFTRNPVYVHVLNQSYIEMWLINQDVYQKAIDMQAALMVSAKSEMVQMKAADSLLTHLAKPKEAITAITINTAEADGMNALREGLAAMAKQQQELIRTGATAKELAANDVVDVEAKNVL